jgi:hypothetical protein
MALMCRTGGAALSPAVASSRRGLSRSDSCRPPADTLLPPPSASRSSARPPPAAGRPPARPSPAAGRPPVRRYELAPPRVFKVTLPWVSEVAPPRSSEVAPPASLQDRYEEEEEEAHPRGFPRAAAVGFRCENVG